MLLIWVVGGCNPAVSRGNVGPESTPSVTSNSKTSGSSVKCMLSFDTGAGTCTSVQWTSNFVGLER